MRAQVSRSLASRLGAGAIRIVALALLMFLSIFYLKLGYFVLFLLPIGALIAVLITRRQREGYPAIRSTLAATAAYCAAIALVWSAAIQNRDEVRDLEWEVVEHRDGSEPEVLLHLGGGDALHSLSGKLRDHLVSRSRATVTVVLPVTRILGCFQGVGFPRIEGWGVVPVAVYETGSEPGPWEEHWWCP